MASFTPKEIDLSQINGGQRYENGDGVTPETLNAPIEAIAYVQAKLLTLTLYKHIISVITSQTMASRIIVIFNIYNNSNVEINSFDLLLNAIKRYEICIVQTSQTNPVSEFISSGIVTFVDNEYPTLEIHYYDYQTGSTGYIYKDTSRPIRSITDEVIKII